MKVLRIVLIAIFLCVDAYLLIVENTAISYNPISVPMLYGLITYSRQHDILIPTYIGMSSLYLRR